MNIENYQAFKDLPAWKTTAIERLVKRMKSKQTRIKYYHGFSQTVKTAKAHLVFYTEWFHKDFHISPNGIFLVFWNCESRQWEATSFGNIIFDKHSK